MEEPTQEDLDTLRNIRRLLQAAALVRDVDLELIVRRMAAERSALADNQLIGELAAAFLTIKPKLDEWKKRGEENGERISNAQKN